MKKREMTRISAVGFPIGALSAFAEGCVTMNISYAPPTGAHRTLISKKGRLA